MRAQTAKVLGDARDAEAPQDKPLPLKLLPFPEVLSAMAEEKTGLVELPSQNRVIVYDELKALHWYLVVVADRNELLAMHNGQPGAPSRPGAPSKK